MITILILTEKLSTNEKIAASIIGGFSGGITIVSTTEPEEAESVYCSEKQIVDVFILQVNMQKRSGFKIAESIRQTEKYRKTPILFITPLSYNMVAFILWPLTGVMRNTILLQLRWSGWMCRENWVCILTKFSRHGVPVPKIKYYS